VFVGSGRAVWVAQKTPGNPEDVAWNVAQGGRFDNVRFNDWPLKVVKTAIEAFNYTDLDFGGVDVIVDNNNAYVLEINSAPSQTSPYRQECVAKYFDYVVKNGKNRIELIKEKGGYLKFIHPAIDNKAKMVNNE
jgi:glutathione synthase/RimK-type ligase-like ATP-grasp enzyme